MSLKIFDEVVSVSFGPKDLEKLSSLPNFEQRLKNERLLQLLNEAGREWDSAELTPQTNLVRNTG